MRIARLTDFCVVHVRELMMTGINSSSKSRSDARRAPVLFPPLVSLLLLPFNFFFSKVLHSDRRRSGYQHQPIPFFTWCSFSVFISPLFSWIHSFLLFSEHSFFGSLSFRYTWVTIEFSSLPLRWFLLFFSLKSFTGFWLSTQMWLSAKKGREREGRLPSDPILVWYPSGTLQTSLWVPFSSSSSSLFSSHRLFGHARKKQFLD